MRTLSASLKYPAVSSNGPLERVDLQLRLPCRFQCNEHDVWVPRRGIVSQHAYALYLETQCSHSSPSRTCTWLLSCPCHAEFANTQACSQVPCSWLLRLGMLQAWTLFSSACCLHLHCSHNTLAYARIKSLRLPLRLNTAAPERPRHTLELSTRLVLQYG